MMVNEAQNVSVKYMCFHCLHFITAFCYFGRKNKLRKPHEITGKAFDFGVPQSCCWGRCEHCETTF